MDGENQRQLLDDDPTLREIVRRLADAYHPLKIYLFGSKARGTAGPDSDYDILVVVSDAPPSQWKGSELASKRLWGVRGPKGVLVCPEGWFLSRATVVTSLPATVIRE